MKKNVLKEDRLDDDAASTSLSFTEPFAVHDLITATGTFATTDLTDMCMCTCTHGIDDCCCCMAAHEHRIENEDKDEDEDDEWTQAVPAGVASPENSDSCINWDSFPSLNDDAVLDDSFDDDSDDDLLSAEFDVQQQHCHQLPGNYRVETHALSQNFVT